MKHLKAHTRKLKVRLSCPACGHFAQRPVTAVMCAHCRTPYFRPFIEDRNRIVVDVRRWMLWMLLILASFMGAAMLIAYGVM